MNKKTIFIATFGLVLALMSPKISFSQIKMGSISGVRPSSEQIESVEKRLSNVQKLVSTPNSFAEANYEISEAEKEISYYKSKFPLYKKTNEWNETLEKLKLVVKENKAKAEKANAEADIANKEKVAANEVVKKEKQAVNEEKEFESTRVGGALAKMPDVEAEIKKILGEYGTVLRVSITEKEWYVRLNDFGTPINKSIYFNAAIKDKDGVCWLYYSSFYKEYQGNGKYESGGYFYDALQGSYFKPTKMNCENVMK